MVDSTAIRTVLVAELARGVAHASGVPREWSFAEWEILEEHCRGILQDLHGLRVDRVDRFVGIVGRTVDAIAFCVRLERDRRALAERVGGTLETRYAVHVGEVSFFGAGTDQAMPAGGPAVQEAASILPMAHDGQVLLSRAAFDLARRGAVGDAALNDDLRWTVHGRYQVDGVPMEICEVAPENATPLAPPAEFQNKHEAVRVDRTSGSWLRAGAGEPVPGRSNWMFTENVAQSAFGETWLIQHRKTGDVRRVKVSTLPTGRAALQKEVEAFERWNGASDRIEGLVTLLDWQLDASPSLVEYEHGGGTFLARWNEPQRGLPRLTMTERVQIVRTIADAVMALHAIGVVHGNIGPESVFVRTDAAGFVGRLTNVSGDFETSADAVGMRTAPELLGGGAKTIASDLYALGVLLYQAVCDDYSKSLAPFWERDVADPTLRADITAMVDRDPARRVPSGERSPSSPAAEPTALPEPTVTVPRGRWDAPRRPTAGPRLLWTLLAGALGFLIGWLV